MNLGRHPTAQSGFIDVSSAAVSEPGDDHYPAAKTDYARITNAKQIREKLLDDCSLPQGLRSLLGDEEIWALYSPTALEIRLVIEKFGKYVEADEPLFREVLGLVRSSCGRRIEGKSQQP